MLRDVGTSATHASWDAQFVESLEWNAGQGVSISSNVKLKHRDNTGTIERNSQKSSIEGRSSKPLTYPSVPLKVKLAEKGRKKQLLKAHGGKQEKDRCRLSAENKVYFDDKPGTAAPGVGRLRKSAAYSSQKRNLLGAAQN